MRPIEVGDSAPEVTLTLHTGEEVSLANFRGAHAVVIFFYPMDGTPVCTKEACTFRDAHEDFTAAGAVVIGVSGDSVARHRAFVAKQRLPFLLAADKGGGVRRAFGVRKSLGIFPSRVTYVIDKQGVVRHIFSALLDADRHVTEALEIVRQLRS